MKRNRKRSKTELNELKAVKEVKSESQDQVVGGSAVRQNKLVIGDGKQDQFASGRGK